MSYFTRVLKYNKNHDPKTGRFTSGPSGGSASPNSISSGVTNLGRAGSYTSTDPMTGNQMETAFHRLDDGRYSMVETNLGEDEGASYQRGVVSHDEFKRKMRAYGGQTINQRSLVDEMIGEMAREYQNKNFDSSGFDKAILEAETAGDKKLARKLRDDLDRAQVEARGNVRANDLKKGTRVQLRNGWEADLVDNGRGNTRLAKVYGNYTEMGSVYTKDILRAQVQDKWKKVELSASQRKTAKKIRAAGW